MRIRRHYFLAGLISSLLSLAIVTSSLHAARIPIIRIIVVKTQPEAEQILAEIDKGASFASLAREKSVDEESRDNYGEIKRGAFAALEAPLKDAALRLKEGEVSGVIEIGDNRYALVLSVDLSPYRKGAKAFRAGDFSNAERYLIKHVALNPDAVKARVMLGRIYAAHDDDGRAEINYRAALGFDPGCEDAYQGLGELYLSMGQLRQAGDVYTEGLRHIPDSHALKSGREKVSALLSSSGDGHPEKQTAESEPPRKAVAPDGTGERKLTKADMAGGTAPKAGAGEGMPSPARSSESPGNERVHLRIIITHNETDAQEILSQLKEGKPFALLARERSADKQTSEGYGYLGEVAVSSLHPSIQKALSKMKGGQTSGIIRIDADNFALVQVTDMALYLEGEKAFVAGDFATAEKKLLSYVKENPDAVKARGMLGKIYEDREEFSRAIEMYRDSISYSPKTVLLYERLARVYLFTGQYQRARNVYIEGLTQVHSSPPLEEGLEMADLLLIGNGEKMP